MRRRSAAGLLKSNYRLDAEGHPELVECCAAVAERLEVKAPVTLYQAAGGLGLNAMLCHLPGEAHIVFTGPILANLTGAELDAVLAHELAHYRLWEMEVEIFPSADRVLLGGMRMIRGRPRAMCSRPGGSVSTPRCMRIAGRSPGVETCMRRSGRW